jgi:hypothetical protein
MNLESAIRSSLLTAASCRWEMAKWAALLTELIADPMEALRLFDSIRRALMRATFQGS